MAGARRWLRRVGVLAVLALFTVELVLGWPSLVSAIEQLRAPRLDWVAAAVAAELGVMGAYARMQRHLLFSAGVRVPLHKHLALAYAAHSLSVTLPGGPAFSTRYNFRQMVRFGASPAVAAWCVALSAILSALALGIVTAVGVFAAGGAVGWTSLVALAVVAVLVVVGVRHLAHDPAALERVGGVALARLNRLRHKPPEQGIDRIHAFEDQLGAARLTPGHGTAAVLYALLNWILDAACLWMCARAVADVPLDPKQVLLAYCAGMAAGSLTIVPAGLGIIDSALVLGLVAAGAPAPTAIASVVLYRIISFGFVIGTGWVVWLLVRRHVRREGRPADDPG
ncbi:YbhN family protein [Pseudonocardia ailaonensis]|uniref:YbhN family protein n=1 Tax=Pseudonocardia ailaonensis TaxID=367279 RepID=A0ABN2MWU5_9PSEU